MSETDAPQHSWPAPHPVIDAPYGPRYTAPPAPAGPGTPVPTGFNRPFIPKLDPLPPVAPTSKKTIALFVSVCLAVAVLGGLVAVQFVTQDSAPTKWDARVVDLVAFVERTTGETFVRPVPVRVLGDSAFEALVRRDSTALTAAEKQKIADDEATGRALGWYNNTTRLFDDTNTLNTASILAYYSYGDREIVARSDQPDAATLDVALRVTVVHELTHALQDQRLDVRAVQGRADTDQEQEAATALVEGHAVWVENAYLASLSAADLEAYDAATNATSSEIDDRVGPANPFLSVPLGAPYIYGPILADAASRTKAGIEQLYVKQPVAMDQVVEPGQYFADDQPEFVAAPQLGTGGVAVATGTVGPVRLYLMLAAVMTPIDAWTAIHDWGNDSYQTYRTPTGLLCLSWNIRGDDAAASTRLRAKLTTWADARVDVANVVVQHASDGAALISISACDPGATTTQSFAGEDAARLFYVRANVLSNLIASTGRLDQATCVTDKLFQQFAVTAIADRGPDVRSTTDRLVTSCA